jgi:uncharacterized membrane protein
MQPSHEATPLSKGIRKFFLRIADGDKLNAERDAMNEEFIADHPQYADLTHEQAMAFVTEHYERENQAHRRKLRSHLENFSDGVIAVIITIMLLSVTLPGDHTTYGFFLKNVGYFFVSFLVIANFWFINHQCLEQTDEIDEAVIVEDFVFLGLLAVIPLLTKWIMQEPTSLAMLNYGVVLIAILVVQDLITYTIGKTHFRRLPHSFTFWKHFWRFRLIGSLVFAVAIGAVGYLFPHVGLWLFLIVPIFNFLAVGMSSVDSRNSKDLSKWRPDLVNHKEEAAGAGLSES